ncbi:hypothetical protein VZT92_004639 [Zoarces viviparus]|uniref:Uncharacterized protein n=1 Tax=Zoarces viviparus TaxID=48416 RepID=A0AAW1FXD0_ZOAVI
MLVTSLAPPPPAGHQPGSSSSCWSPAWLLLLMLVTSLAPPPHAGHQPGSSSSCWSPAWLLLLMLVTSLAPPPPAGHQPGSSSSCWSPAWLLLLLLVTSLAPPPHAGHQPAHTLLWDAFHSSSRICHKSANVVVLVTLAGTAGPTSVHLGCGQDCWRPFHSLYSHILEVVSDEACSVGASIVVLEA